MRYLLDTNACIGYLNGRAMGVRERLHSVHAKNVFVCSVVRAELFYGAMKSDNPLETRRRQDIFLRPFESLPFDDAAAEVYGQIRAHLERSGQMIGPNDLLIAAIAIANQVILVTHNLREFSRVPGLLLEDWQS